MRRELTNVLDRVGVHLVEEIDTDNGLFIELLSKQVLTSRQLDTCKAKATSADRVEEILRLLKRRPDECYLKFCEVLDAAGRHDLVEKYLTPDKFIQSQESAPAHHSIETSSRLSNESSDAPSAISFEQAFRGRHYELQQMLELSGLLTGLFDARIITSQQYQEINNPAKTKNEKVAVLLEKLEQRPVTDLETFCKILDATNQSHIVRDHMNH